MSMDKTAYSALTAKICGMSAKLLKEDDYQMIASMKSVTELITWLCDYTVYGKFLKELDVSFYHRGNIEKILINSLYDDCKRLYRFSNGKQKDFIKLYMKKFENPDGNPEEFLSSWKTGKKIPDKTNRLLYLNNMGQQIDLRNLQWIYRAKKYYHLDGKDIYPMLIPIHHKLTTEQVKRLCESPNEDEFLRIVNEETYYGKKCHFDEEHSIEKTTDVWLNHLYVTEYRKNPHSIAGIYQYLFRKEKEITTIITAMECIRYGLPEAEILAYIKRPVWQDYQGGNDK